MANYVTQAGKEITFNFRKVTHKQWKGLFFEDDRSEDREVTLARIYGIPREEVDELDFIDFQKCFDALIEAAGKPIDLPSEIIPEGAPPNSPRASTLESK